MLCYKLNTLPVQKDYVYKDIYKHIILVHSNILICSIGVMHATTRTMLRKDGFTLLGKTHSAIIQDTHRTKGIVTEIV